MKKLVIFSAVLITGCATGLNSMQNQELMGYQAKGLAIEEKSTGTATALGFLPGGGSFYTRHYGLGAVNLLLWPYSILWDPISGHNGAEEINYYATVANCNKLKNTEISNLDTLLMTQQIDNGQYVLQKRTIENKYSPIESTVATTYEPYVQKTPLVNRPAIEQPKPYYQNPPVVKTAVVEPTPYYENNQQIHSRKSGNDLTHCLQLQTNEEMIKCAEKGR